MSLWNGAELMAATNGKLLNDFTANGISIDTRTLQPGDLFVALKGPNFDGHDFVRQALEHGAGGIMVSQAIAGLDVDAPVLFVKDTLVALEDIARVARERSKAKIIAVTGSVGKTGTKEALLKILSVQGKTFGSSSSFNNHIGVPLTLARLPADAEYAVFEIGMNHSGEITPLVKLLNPHAALITNVEAAHLGNFKSIEEIADAKAEIFAGLDVNGTAILNHDNPHYARLLAAARTRGVQNIWSFGQHDGADAQLMKADLSADSSAVAAQFFGAALSYELSLAGQHHVINSLAVLLGVKALGADVKSAADSLSTLTPIAGRGARQVIELGNGSFTLLDESYNASPVAVRAALDVLALIKPSSQGRRVAVFGDMRELGDDAPKLHADLAPFVQKSGVELVLTCGPLMKSLHDVLPGSLKKIHAEDSATLALLAVQHVMPDDVVLVKGSNGSRMKLVVEALQALQQSENTKESHKKKIAGER